MRRSHYLAAHAFVASLPDDAEVAPVPGKRIMSAAAFAKRAIRAGEVNGNRFRSVMELAERYREEAR